MARGVTAPLLLAALALVGALASAACAQQQAPAAEPGKPAAAEPAKAAAQPAPAAKPAAQPAKPAAEAPKPAAQPAKPAVEAPKPAAQPKVELRMGVCCAKGSVDANVSEKFAEIVEQKSKGELLVRLFIQSLGVEGQLTQAVMTGSVDVGMISNGNAGRFTEAFFVYDLPFLFKTYENLAKSLDTPVGRRLVEKFEKDLEVKLLWVTTFGIGRDVQTRSKALKVPADIRGLKIRVVSTPVDLATFKAWGANPTPVDWGQTYAALQQGVVDGENIVIPSILAAKHYEVVKHNIRLDYQAPFEVVFINQKTFAGLSAEHQKLLLEAAKEAETWNRKDSAELVRTSTQELTTKYGFQIYQPAPAEYAQWASIREKVWEEVAAQQKGKIDLNLAKAIYEGQ